MTHSFALGQLFIFAKRLASQGRFEQMIDLCLDHLRSDPNDIRALGEIGNFLLGFGCLGAAEQCFNQIGLIDQLNLIGLSGRANIALSMGLHDLARKHYENLEKLFPENRSVRRNALMQMEYDPQASGQDRYLKAIAWGNWVTDGKHCARPPFRSIIEGEPLRVGYVSPDFCQHTVGLMLRDVITRHTHSLIRAYVYHTGSQVDWITKLYEEKTVYRFGGQLTDDQLYQQIVNDEIDILVDLSGHTAGSRLELFALRPAPVQISWLGYFATTGLRSIDAVLLDDASMSPDVQKYFCERIYRLTSRFSYTPLPGVPEVNEFPCKKNGYLTFGSFNNTAKLNSDVIQLWARLLNLHPSSRLILKWRTLLDQCLKDQLIKQFGIHGIAAERLEFRGASYHLELLREYGDIDIALDPFPFNGAQTSCDALLMGVPVITMAQERPVSRQGASILSTCKLNGLVATSIQGYIDRTLQIFEDIQSERMSRSDLRKKFLDSAICNSHSYTQNLEDLLIQVYEDTRRSTQAS